MAINIPVTLQEIIDRMRVDFSNEVDDSNPFLPNSFVNGVITGTAGRSFDAFYQLGLLQRESFLLTAQTLPFILRHGLSYGLTPNPATGSIGNIVIQGTEGVIIPAGTFFQSSVGITFETQDSESIGTLQTSIQSLTSGSGIAFATLEDPHGFASGMTVTISGATQPEYNTTSQIVVTGVNSFSYDIIGNPPPEPGLPQVEATFASLVVESLEVGVNTNLSSGEEVVIQTSIAGADSIARTDFNQVSGGADEESTADYKSRVLFRRQNPVTQFNPAQIETIARTVPGVTRVFVQRVTPSPGEVTVLFTRDNDDDIIPNPAQVEQVRQALLPFVLANMDEDFLHVNAPDPVITDFVMNTIVPDSPSMRIAIEENLEQFFTESTNIEEDVTEDQYRCAILGTVDPVTGDLLRTFNLVTPIGTISVGPGQIATLGTVSIT